MGGKTDGTATPKEGFAVALCDPFGYVPAAAGTSQGATFTSAGALSSPTATYDTNKQYYSGVASGAKGVQKEAQKFWDPITAAQASDGAFCCDALYYGTDGLGRGSATADPPIVGVTKNEDFTPIPLTGNAMQLEVAPGGNCPASGTGKEGLSEVANVKQKEMLEGQAFYAVLAPSQYVLPKVSSVTTTQTANASKQKICAETITKMLKVNKVAPGTSTTDASCKKTALVIAGNPSASADSGSCSGTDYSAIEYPLWMVGIGGGTTGGTAAAFNGVAKLSTLQSSPDMSTKPTALTNACGYANEACAAAPSTWTGGQSIFQLCSKTAGDETSCTLAEKQGQTGMLPTS